MTYNFTLGGKNLMNMTYNFTLGVSLRPTNFISFYLIVVPDQITSLIISQIKVHYSFNSHIKYFLLQIIQKRKSCQYVEFYISYLNP